MPAPFLHSTVGKKVVVALTGLVLYLFIVGHLLGNLQIFLGPEKLNAYGRYLHETAPLLWGARIVLLVSVFFHFLFTVQLTIHNRRSRPVGYAMHEPIQASAASRFMIWSGLFLIFFVVYHILHFTTGAAHPQFNPLDVYGNVVIGFSSAPVIAVYALAMISLGFHLSHGVYSLFQTLGLNHPKYNSLRRALALASGWLIPIGYLTIPAAVALGILVIR
jgi:succinate dehydrogenase / fumarate reductase, cytochrome b subunit